MARRADTDFTVERLVDRADGELANGIGNLQSRALTLVHKYRGGRVPAVVDGPSSGPELREATGALPKRIDAALERFDFRAATDAIWAVVDAGNRFVEAERPWELAGRESRGDRAAAARLDEVLGLVLAACRVLGTELTPFVPHGAAALRRQSQAEFIDRPTPVFPRIGRA